MPKIIVVAPEAYNITLSNILIGAFNENSLRFLNMSLSMEATQEFRRVGVQESF